MTGDPPRLPYPGRYDPTLPALRITLSHSLRLAAAAAAGAGDGVLGALPGDDAMGAAFDAAEAAVSGPAGRPGGVLRAAFEAAYRAVPPMAGRAVRDGVGGAVLGAPDLLASAAAHKAAVDALFKRFGGDAVPSARTGILGAAGGDPWEGRLAAFRAMHGAALDAARSARDGTSRYAAPYTEREAAFDAESLASVLAARASRTVRRRTALDAAVAAALAAAARSPGMVRGDGALEALLAGTAPGDAVPAGIASGVAGLSRRDAGARAAGTARRITLEALYGVIVGGAHRTSRGVLPFASNYDAALRGACGPDRPSKLEAAILEDAGVNPPSECSWSKVLGDAYPEVRPINYLEAGRSPDNVGLRIFYETIHYVAYPAARSAKI